MRTALERGWEMKKVTVKTSELLETLQKNMEQHIKDYQEAVNDYKAVARDKLAEHIEKAVARLEKSAGDIREKIDTFNPSDPDRVRDTVTILQSVQFTLPVPQDHRKDYEVAIQMCKWEVNETIELSQDEFQCFVLDDWTWKDDFLGTKMSYEHMNRRRQ